MEFGHFSADGKEYVIKKYDHSRPWINYLCNGDYCSLISHTGGGYSFYKDPRDLRMTKYRFTNVKIDRPGKYVYIRDNDEGNYWSLGWQPVMAEPTFYECRHGLGYTKIKTVNNEIESEATFFVPEVDECEIWDCKIKNTSDRKRNLNITFYVEFSHFNAVDEQLSYANKKFFSDVYWNEELGLINSQEHFNWLPIGKVFFGLTNQKVDGYDCVRQEFIGHHRDEGNPIAVEKGTFNNSTLVGGDGCGALTCVVELEPGEEKSFVTILGVDMREDSKAAALKAKYSNADTIKAELDKVKATWEDYRSNMLVKTPDNDANQMLNIWHQYQCKTNFDWSRYASAYNTGTGRGIGFRDTCQDTIAVTHAIPGKVKDKLKLLGSNMYEDGHSYHLFFPISKTGDPTLYGDDHLWYILAVDNYLRETGDLGFVEEKIPYIEGTEGSVYEHMRRSIDYACENSGPNGLPLMYFADWNDCLNNICLKEKGSKGESVWVGMQLYYVTNLLIRIAGLTGHEADIPELEKIAARVKKTINEVAWDGDWYMRAFTDEGKKVGSKECDEGQIYLMTQTWAVLSGVFEDDRGVKAMDSVDRMLNSEYGIRLLAPAYTKFPLDIGSLIHYPAGLKENAGIFCHSNTWAIIAEALLGRGEKAYEYYQKIFPPKISAKVGHDKFGVEPYSYSQFIYGPDHKDFGVSSHSWLTGTAAWSYKAITDYILGVRPEYEGLKLDPCIPGSWDGFEVTRIFRGTKYNITVENKSGEGHGVKSIEVNGQVQDSNVVVPTGDEITVKVVL